MTIATYETAATLQLVDALRHPQGCDVQAAHRALAAHAHPAASVPFGDYEAPF